MLLAAFVLSAALVAAVLWRNDLWEAEPWWAYVAAPAAGAVAMAAGFGVSLLLEMRLGAGLAGAWWSFGVFSAVPEELAKLGGAAALAAVMRRHFGNDPFDGLFYGGLIGVGAAATETVIALRGGGDALTLSAETAVRTLAHPLLASVTCAGLGLVRTGLRRRVVAGATAGTAALGIGLHFGWNTVRQAAEGRAGDAAMDPTIAQAWTAGIVVAGAVVFGGLVLAARQVSLRLFPERALRPLFTPDRRGAAR